MGCTRLAAGCDSREDFGEVFRLNRDHVMRFCLRLTRHLQDAEDLCQETFLRGYRRIDQLDEIDSIRPWLLRIATNAFIGLYRRARRRDERSWSYDDVVAHADAALAVHRPEAPAPILVHGEVLAAVETLPVAFREAVTLVDLGDTEYAEAARILSVPVGTVMSRLHRGRGLLRDRLSSYVGGVGLVAA